MATVGWVTGILEDFPDVVNAGGSLPVPIHDVQHHIKTNGPPIASYFRRLEGAKLEAARKEFEAMEQEGIVQRSTSPWASPLHMVPRKMVPGGRVAILDGSILPQKLMSILFPTC